MDNRVKVGVRIRPMVTSEHEAGCCNVVREDRQRIVAIDSTSSSNSSVPQKRVAYEYDWVFGPSAHQKSVYSSVCEPLVAKIFEGINATVFAYGQTGSGKTFTMGNATSPLYGEGIITLAIKDIFSRRDSLKEQGVDVAIELSYLEVYMEECYDLLADSENRPRLDLRETPKGETIVDGLTQKSVFDINDVAKLLSDAAQNRSTGRTAMNAHSSRSHAICTLSLKVSRPNECSLCAKLHLVDLAGSERAKKTQATGDVFQEGVSINKSLFALGNVVSALAKGSDENSNGNSNNNNSSSSNNGFIPYRESKLTRLLKDALGGNGLTVMLACVSPSDGNLEETLNTLRFSSRASSIVNSVKINQNNDDLNSADSEALRKEVQQLRQQVDLFKLKCEYLTSVVATGGQVTTSSQNNDTMMLMSSSDSSMPSSVQSSSNSMESAATLPLPSLLSVVASVSTALKKVLVTCLEEEIEINDDVVSGIKGDIMESTKSIEDFTKSLEQVHNDSKNKTTSVVSTSSDIGAMEGLGDESMMMMGDFEFLPSIVAVIDILTKLQKFLSKYDKNGIFSFESDDMMSSLGCYEDGMSSGSLEPALENFVERCENNEARVKEDIEFKQLEISKMLVLTEKFESTISQLKEEIKTLQTDKQQLMHNINKPGASNNNNKSTNNNNNNASNEDLKLKKELKDKSRLLEEKLKELKLRESEYLRVQQQRERFCKEIEQLRNELDHAKKKKVDLVKKMKEEGTQHLIEKQKLQTSEAQLRRKECLAQLSLQQLKTQLALKEKAWQGRLNSREVENQRLTRLLQNRDKARAQKEGMSAAHRLQNGAGGLGGPGGANSRDGKELSIPRQSELKAWISQETETQRKRIALAEEIQKMTDHRGKVARKLQSLRADKDNDENSLEIRTLEEEVRRRSALISQKQGDLGDLGVVTEKKRFSNIMDLKEARLLMEWLFDKACHGNNGNSSTNANNNNTSAATTGNVNGLKNLYENKIRSQQLQIEALKRALNNNNNNSGSSGVSTLSSTVATNSGNNGNSVLTNASSTKRKLAEIEEGLQSTSVKAFMSAAQARLQPRSVSAGINATSSGSSKHHSKKGQSHGRIASTNSSNNPTSKSSVSSNSPDDQSGESQEHLDQPSTSSSLEEEAETSKDMDSSLNSSSVSCVSCVEGEGPLSPHGEMVHSSNGSSSTSTNSNAPLCDSEDISRGMDSSVIGDEDNLSENDYEMDETLDLDETFYPEEEEEDEDEEYREVHSGQGSGVDRPSTRTRTKTTTTTRPKVVSDPSNVAHDENVHPNHMEDTQLRSSNSKLEEPVLKKSKLSRIMDVEALLSAVMGGTPSSHPVPATHTKTGLGGVLGGMMNNMFRGVMSSSTSAPGDIASVDKPLNQYTVKELKAMLAQRGLATSGLKDDLIKRLEVSMSSADSLDINDISHKMDGGQIDGQDQMEESKTAVKPEAKKRKLLQTAVLLNSDNNREFEL